MPGRLAPAIFNAGYIEWFQSTIYPQVDAGFRNFYLHMPHGQYGDGVFPLDALTVCGADPAAGPVLRQLPQALRNLHRYQPDARVLLYFGSPWCESMRKLERRDDWVMRALAEVMPYYVAPNVDFGIDQGNVIIADPALFWAGLLDMSRSWRGCSVWYESAPLAALPATHSRNLTMTLQWWRRSRPDQRGSRWAAPTDKLTGRKCLILEAGNTLADAREVLDLPGGEVATVVGPYIRQGMDADDLLRSIME